MRKPSITHGLFTLEVAKHAPQHFIIRKTADRIVLRCYVAGNGLAAPALSHHH